MSKDVFDVSIYNLFIHFQFNHKMVFWGNFATKINDEPPFYLFITDANSKSLANVEFN